MGEQVSGTVTFVFTDIEGSTRRWQRFGDAMRDALERHDSLVAAAIEGAGGRIFKHTGDGMCAAFASAQAAVMAAVDLQRRLAAEDWSMVDGLAVRVGIHVGEATVRDGDYFGPTLNRAARVMAAGHGGQVLLSNAAAALVGPALADGDVTLAELGEYALRDLDTPERLHQVLGAGLRAEFPPPRVERPAARWGSGRLPVARTEFVGRAGDIDAVAGLLDAGGESCLVTLVGIGGTGKTRLAVEVARRVGDRYDGVAFVDLAPLTDGAHIPAAMASALGVAVVGGPGAVAMVDAVVGVLGVRSQLVVIDNCEHLVEECAELVDVLLDACPGATFLATSREALAVEGERTWPVGSLPVDEAVELFVDRARAADARAEVTAPAARATVEEICRRLDGIPLAIELAASRVAHLSLDDLAARLDDRFRLLTGGRQRRAQRQQTLQATIDWSHDLLDRDERALLRRLSVFVGGFTLDAAEQVCAGDPIGPGRVVDALGALVAKSLVVADRTASSTRYRMLETIRLYAADRLVEAGEAHAARDRNSDLWRQWLGRFPPDDLVHDMDAVRSIEPELDNIRAAIDWSQASGRADVAAELVAAIPAMWAFRGHHEEGASRLLSLVDADGIDDATRARCLAALSQVAMATGDFAAMADAAARSLALEPEGPLAPLALVYAALFLVFDVARYPEAHRLHDEARRVADVVGAPGLRELADAHEAHFFVVEGSYERVVELGRRTPPRPTFAELNLRLATHAAHLLRDEPQDALREARTLEAIWPEWMQSQAALALLELGDREGATAAALAGAALFLEQPYPLLVADTLVAFAALALDAGDAARCASILAATTAERGLASFRSPSIAMLARRYLRAARGRLSEEDYHAARRAGRASASLATFHQELARLEGTTRT